MPKVVEIKESWKPFVRNHDRWDLYEKIRVRPSCAFLCYWIASLS